MKMVGGLGRSSRDVSPDLARVYMPPKMKAFKKVQIVYYLCRNGKMEHPHFVEVSHLPNQHLRLKDVMDRLSLLRGRAMSSLYSWSCKRTYKSGYVWNDLGENDVIYPTDGGEYVLKGSEIIEGRTENFQQLRLNPNPITKKPPPIQTNHLHQDDEIDEGEKAVIHTTTTATTTKCSRGASTDELALTGDEFSSSSTSSDKTTTKHHTTIHHYMDMDMDMDYSKPTRTPSSLLLQLIACGSVAVKGKPRLAYDNGNISGRKSLHGRGDVEEDKYVIRYMSENPRFGKAEEKEYFSGSIVESMTMEGVAKPCLKRSNSYNEERSIKCGIKEDAEKINGVKSAKGKCIPGRRKSVIRQP